MPSELLIIFVKQPELGKVKTRLAATVGNQKALEIYHQLLERTRTITQPLVCDKVVYYSPSIQDNDLWDIECYRKEQQVEGDLGKRMQQAFEASFARGYQRVCIIGSDCYELTTKIIEQAFAALRTQEVVIGPSTDGGYYLLGMRQLYTGLFENQQWSTSSVYQDSVCYVEKQSLAWQSLPTLTDVDEEKDLSTMNER